MHSLVLAKQCQEFCNAYLVEKQQNIKSDLVKFTKNFEGKSLGGSKLFLECCYSPEKIPEACQTGLQAEPSGQWVQEAWMLAHAVNAPSILHATTGFVGAAVHVDSLRDMPPWIEAARHCHADEVKEKLVQGMGEMLARNDRQVYEEFAMVVPQLAKEDYADIMAAFHEQTLASIPEIRVLGGGNGVCCCGDDAPEGDNSTLAGEP